VHKLNIEKRRLWQIPSIQYHATLHTGSNALVLQ
jgi:hypothetical protein